MLKYFTFLLIFIKLSFASAQIDNEFWFAAPEVAQAHADRPVFLRISTLDKDATVTISQPANNAFSPMVYTIPANSMISVDLTARISQLENIAPDVVANKGLFIKSTALITAYYEVLGRSAWGVVNCDIFSLKGKNALGTRFYTPFQNFWRNNVGYSSFDIVATEDGTMVTITPTRDLVGHSAGIPFSVNLNKGETYSARAIGLNGSDHASGSLITSNKPIAVTLKDDSLYEGGSYDLAGDQLIPVSLTGMEYVVIKTSVNTIRDRIFICATENVTDIFINGNTIPSATLQEGETFNYLLTGNYEFVRSSKPVYIFHIAGFGNELGGALLPPVGCTGSRQVGFTRPTSETFALSIVVKTGGEGDFILNGSAAFVQASDFNIVPGTGGQWKAAHIIFTNENIISAELPNLLKNDSTDFHLGILNGSNSTGFRYGYFSDFGALELGPDQAICKGDSIIFNGGFGMTSYDWSTGESSQYITVKDSGTYWVEIERGLCILRDTIDFVHVAFNPGPGKVLGNDTAVCSKEEYVIEMDTLYSFYTWQNGNTEPTHKPETTGLYWVEVKNNFGCKETDSIYVIIHPSPNPVIFFNHDLETICWDSTITLEATAGYKNYLWHNGDTNRIIDIPHLDEYYVKVTDFNDCTDSTNLYIDCSPVVKVYNLFTPNGDGLNDIFFVKGLKPKKWILEINTRWGERVYYNKNYNNDWNGEGLESGIYYYVLHHVEGKKTFKGWVHIINSNN